MSSGKNYSIHTRYPSLAPLSGSWEIRFPHGWGVPNRIVLDTLVSWTALQSKNVKYFSGEANYHKIFDYAPEGNDMGLSIWLDLGKVSKVTEVYLNGHHLGIKWFQPFIYNITKFIKPGKNYLIVEVANVWSNQMTGDANRIPEDKRTHSNITRGHNAWMTPYANLELVESGLLGPVTIQSYNHHKLK